MKKLLVCILASGSISCFANEVCSLHIDKSNIFTVYCDNNYTQYIQFEGLIKASKKIHNDSNIKIEDIQDKLAVSLIQSIESNGFILRAQSRSEQGLDYTFAKQ